MGLGKKELPKRVVSIGGRLGYIDNGNVANSQITLFQWDDALLISDVRGLEIKTLPELDLERVQTAWQEAVFALYLAEDKIERLVKVSETGQVVYKAEKGACRAFPDPQRDELARGSQRNFQILDPLEFLAEFTQHIPPQSAHLIRYYGWYSNKARGLRRKQAEAAAAGEIVAAKSPAGASTGEAEPAPARSRASQTWAMLIKRVYEIAPLICPRCSGQMQIVAFLEPPQGDVIEKILRGHRRAAMVGGLWVSRSAPGAAGRGPPRLRPGLRLGQ